MQSVFDGRRLVLFSGGPREADDQVLLEVREIREGGGSGSIMGRNVFQRDRRAALRLLDSVIKIYAGETK